jgi:hypothetical protein
MKTLKEHIFKNTTSYNNYENYLLEKLCCHCSLEFKFINGKGLDPRFNYYNSIYESLGKFDNAGKVIEHICNELKNNFKTQQIDCRNDNVFFNYINIEINNEHNVNMSYIKYKDNIIFIELYSLNINEFIENIDEYEKLFLHELLHGYEDYNRITSGKDSIFNLIGNEYDNAFKNLNNSNDLKMYLSRCKYFLNPQERNAYFTSLETSIKKLLKSGNYYLDKFDFNKFKKDLKHTDIWTIYFDLFIFIEKLKTLNQYKDIIKRTYNQLFEDNKSFKDIYKELQNKWRKFNSKFNQLVPKILCNNLQIKESREFSFTINKLNEPFEL